MGVCVRACVRMRARNDQSLHLLFSLYTVSKYSHVNKMQMMAVINSAQAMTTDGADRVNTFNTRNV